MKNQRVPAVLLSLVILLALATSIVAAAPDAPGTPTARWVTLNATTAEIRADGITDGGVSGNGAISWDFYFRFPGTVAAPYPAISITPGSAWTGMSPCTFTTNVAAALPSEPGAAGDRGVLISGFCTTGVPNNPVTGSNVLIATVTLGSCPTAPGGFVMDLASGSDVFGEGVTQIIDRSNDPYTLTDADLTDGEPMCAPTAVTMSGFDATTDSPAPFAAAAWPLLAGAVAVAAGGAYALLRRKS